MARIFKVWYGYFALYASLTFLGVLCFSWSMAAIPLYFLLPRRLGTVVGRRGITAAFRIYAWSLRVFQAYRLDLRAVESLDSREPLILAPNHPSLIDALLIIAFHPNIVCVMKGALMRNMFLGGGSRLARYVKNDSPRQMIKQSVEHLQQGGVLLLFPEGTRTTRSPVNSFAGSLALISKIANVPVQTLLIETDSAFLSKGWSLFRRPALPITYRTRLGRRFAAPSDVSAFTSELESYFKKELETTLQSRWLR